MITLFPKDMHIGMGKGVVFVYSTPSKHKTLKRLQSVTQAYHIIGPIAGKRCSSLNPLNTK